MMHANTAHVARHELGAEGQGAVAASPQFWQAHRNRANSGSDQPRRVITVAHRRVAQLTCGGSYRNSLKMADFRFDGCGKNALRALLQDPA